MKKLFLLPAIAMFALVGCGQQPAAPAGPKEWKAVTAQPVAGTNYRLVLDRSADTAEATGGLWALNGRSQKDDDNTKPEYYLTTVKGVEAGAAVEVKVATGGFTVKIGTKYLFIGKVDETHTNNLLKETEAEASVLTYDLTNGFGITASEHFWGMGTRNDRTFTTVNATDFTQYPNNYKVILYEYK